MTANLTSKVWNLELLWSQELLLMLSWSPLVNRYLLYIDTNGQPQEYMYIQLSLLDCVY